ncbi:hypothetical protein EVAR_68335_1 [Eumeta japonica]|uniref:Uncharacterized protein n=1 Tax=Eumeta variegata TaxID=151549 RepID=A0A4C2A8V7_EUMVA|nr:hypothetical protein EVAR_68335_1 [Eumeta japonica]
MYGASCGSVLQMMGVVVRVRMWMDVRWWVVYVRRCVAMCVSRRGRGCGGGRGGRRRRVTGTAANVQMGGAAVEIGRQRKRGARRPPVPALVHVRGALRRAAACAPPWARQRMPARLVRAPVVALAARHPSRSGAAPSLARASPPRHSASDHSAP